MAQVRIVHPEHDGDAVVTEQALEHHYRGSGWMLPEELGDYRARVAEREQRQAAAAKAAKTRAATAEGSEEQ
jgi:hypothetical protein